MGSQKLFRRSRKKCRPVLRYCIYTCHERRIHGDSIFLSLMAGNKSDKCGSIFAISPVFPVRPAPFNVIQSARFRNFQHGILHTLNMTRQSFMCHSYRIFKVLSGRYATRKIRKNNTESRLVHTDKCYILFHWLLPPCYFKPACRFMLFAVLGSISFIGWGIVTMLLLVGWRKW